MKDNYRLRPWTHDDLNDLVSEANNPKIARFLTDQFPHPYTLESGQAFLKMVMNADPVNVLAIEVEGIASGAIGIHPQKDIFRMNGELGYWLAEKHWGKGIMTNAIKDMVLYAFKKFDINRIFTRPYGNNIGSQRVLEKAGFVFEARFEKTIIKNGELLDELVYSIRKK